MAGDPLPARDLKERRFPVTSPRCPTCDHYLGPLRAKIDRLRDSALDLLYVDESIVVANKPSGLLVHRGWANDEDVALFRVRDLVGSYVYPVHRLDRGTSGALLFARTREVAARMGHAIEAREIEKTYLALVRGTPPDDGVIDHPIPRSEGGPRAEAITRFRKLARSPVDRCSLLLARPETGRLHQIRRHCHHISHPIVGDVKHGSGEINRHYRAHYGLTRLALHACSIAFTHPTTGVRIETRAPIPEDLANVLDALELGEQARGLLEP